MTEPNHKETQKKEIADLMNKSAALKQAHQATAERLEQLKKETDEFLKDAEDERQEDKS